MLLLRVGTVDNGFEYASPWSIQLPTGPMSTFAIEPGFRLFPLATHLHARCPKTSTTVKHWIMGVIGVIQLGF